LWWGWGVESVPVNAKEPRLIWTGLLVVVPPCLCGALCER
jgi:hypothetical protein